MKAVILSEQPKINYYFELLTDLIKCNLST